MANSQAFATVAKVDALKAICPNASTINAALYLASATTGAGNTVYTSTGEVSGTNYSAGGVAVTHATAARFSTPKPGKLSRGVVLLYRDGNSRIIGSESVE